MADAVQPRSKGQSKGLTCGTASAARKADTCRGRPVGELERALCRPACKRDWELEAKGVRHPPSRAVGPGAIHIRIERLGVWTGLELRTPGLPKRLNDMELKVKAARREPRVTTFSCSVGHLPCNEGKSRHASASAPSAEGVREKRLPRRPGQIPPGR
jgi:hypothetical protein